MRQLRIRINTKIIQEENIHVVHLSCTYLDLMCRLFPIGPSHDSSKGDRVEQNCWHQQVGQLDWILHGFVEAKFGQEFVFRPILVLFGILHLNI